MHGVSPLDGAVCPSQGDADDTVPAENVIDMCRRNGIALEIVPGGDHRLVGSLMAEVCSQSEREHQSA